MYPAPPVTSTVLIGPDDPFTAPFTTIASVPSESQSGMDLLDKRAKRG
jgi:hypothetical protein